MLYSNNVHPNRGAEHVGSRNLGSGEIFGHFGEVWGKIKKTIFLGKLCELCENFWNIPGIL